MELKHLKLELEAAKKRSKKNKWDSAYKVPFVWTLDYVNELRKSENELADDNILHGNHSDVTTDFFDYHLQSVEYLLRHSDKNIPRAVTRENLWKSSCYNMFVRYATAYSHDEKSIESDNELFRNKGTLLKSISLLPYISAMGFNHIHLLPVTPIGKHGKKGNSGSPYAIKNPMMIEEELSEPGLELSSEDMFKIFTGACHSLGIAVTTEFIFRTSSLDSDLALDNPDWFYWISNKVKDREDDSVSDAKYGRPNYSKKDLKEIHQKVSNEDFSNSISPREKYIKMFTPPPSKVARVDGRIVGFLDKKNTARIPFVFADWPPDDPQPEWSDVTYYKFFDQAKYNYIAYNTIRMYDTELNKSENENSGLWNFITEILPYWVNRYSLDGALLDMAHALPEKMLLSLKDKVHSVDSNFILLGEFFSESDLSSKYFDGIVGDICLSNNDPSSYLKNVRKYLSNYKADYLLSAENHNTKRVSQYPNSDYVLMSIFLNSFLPGVFYIMNGTEVYDAKPMNTGLGFSEEEAAELPTNQLPLFSAMGINWNNQPSLIRLIRDLNKLRQNIFSDGRPEYEIVEDNSSSVNTSDVIHIIARKDNETFHAFANIASEEWLISNPSDVKIGWNYEHRDGAISLRKFGVIICA